MTAKDRATLKAGNASDFPDNSAREISAADLRGQMDDTADSALFPEDISNLDLSDADVTSSGGVTRPLEDWTQDIIDGGGGGASGDFTYGTTGAITWPVTTRMREQVYLLDFIPQSEHAAIRNSTSTFDCSDAFEDAMNSVSVPVITNPVPYLGGPEVIFPYGTCYFSRTIEIKKTMILSGYGQGGRAAWSSRLLFAADITGITVNYRTTIDGTMDPPVAPPPGSGTMTKGGDASTIRNLAIHSKSNGVRNPALNETGSGVGHGIGHGIWCRAQCVIENCLVQYFPQHGIYIRASSGVTNNPDGWAVYGNANLVQVYHTGCLTNGGCGLYVDGPDTNACLFYGMDISGNLLSAVRDSSLIGNTHIMPHTDANGKDACCSYATGPGPGQNKRYYCRDEYRANNNAPAWTISTVYAVRNMVRNAGNLYKCVVAGISAASGAGPTSTGTTNIIDGGVQWKFVAVDANIKIPPEGHAQSAGVWGWMPEAPPVTNPDTHAVYPPWPSAALATPGVDKIYRLGFTFWFDQSSAHNILIGAYIEGGQPYWMIEPPGIAIGNQRLDPDSGGTMFRGGGTSALIRPGIQIDSRTGSARAFTININPSADIAQNWILNGDHASGLSFAWDELNGVWRYIHANSTARVPISFSTDLTTVTGGRTTAIPAGNAIFSQGMWLGRHPTYTRHLSMAEAQPTTGRWAAGDYVFNATPGGSGAVLGWRCITTGDFAGTPPVFQANRPSTSQQTVVASAVNPAFTLLPASSPYHTFYTGTMPGDRIVTLSTTSATNGMTYRITRTAGGAFNLNVGTGPLKAMATNTWADFTYDGTAWYLGASGSLL